MSRQLLSLKARALRYLSAREHSRQELAGKLGRYANDGEDVDALLNELEAAGWLSDARFSDAMVRRRSTRMGNSRILHELRTHGIDGVTLQEIKQSLERDEGERAVEVWRKKFGQPPTDVKERARQMRFLQQRGFSHSAIKLAMQTESENIER